MSFKLFIYYCALCGAWAAFVGWGLGWVIKGNEGGLGADTVKGLFLGMMVALALGVLDAVWNLTGHRYAQVLQRGLFLGALGAVAGLLGAAFGHWLVNLTSKVFFVILGWTLVGLVIGASVGLYDFLARTLAGDTSGGGVRKVLNGLIGGTLGGFLGGFLFVFLGRWAAALFHATEPPRISSALGFVALGACIGLFVGLAQVILKEAWIKVESGRRAGREMILSKDETTIGRAEACDLGLFGDNAVEKMHARIVLKKGRYLLADADTPGGTYLNDRRIDGLTPLHSGDAIRVGGCVLRFGERQKRKK
jgi:MFS family permease